MFNVTINDISVIYVTAHRCAGGLKKKYDLRSGYQQRQWGKYCNDIFVADKNLIAASLEESEQCTTEDVTPEGWALKQVKSRPRFSRHITDYLKGKYQEGELTGRKITPQEVEREMKQLRTEDGQKFFKPSEVLSTSQIASFFARVGRSTSKDSAASGITNDEDLMSVLAAIEEETILQSFI